MRSNDGMEESAVIHAALDAVGPRLKALRAQRKMSLTELALHTGISKSTLSRLETGQRRASLELLLPLAQAYQVPLDVLVGSPEFGDPRVRAAPKVVNGRIVVPLTRHASSVQAWKIIIPATQVDPKIRVHAGYEWLYVLSGRMRLILGDRDLTLDAGEVAEFDTAIPHWFGSAGDGPAEVLSLLNRDSEHAHMRSEVKS